MTFESTVSHAGSGAPGLACGTGRVATPQGWAVSGATVTLIGGDGSQLGRATTDAEGGFTLADLRPGPATLLVAAAAHDPQALAVTVPAGGRWEVGDIRIARTGEGATPRPGIWVVDAVHSSVRAKAQHLGLGGVSGGFRDLAGVVVVDPTFTRSRVEVVMQAASIDTGNAQRDAHLRSPDFLDIERYPTLRYEADRVERDGDGWRIPGHLTLVGTTRPVALRMTYLGSGPDQWGGYRAGFTATTDLRRHDFRLNWNQAVGAGIDALGTTLRVTIDIEAVLQA